MSEAYQSWVDGNITRIAKNYIPQGSNIKNVEVTLDKYAIFNMAEVNYLEGDKQRVVRFPINLHADPRKLFEHSSAIDMVDNRNKNTYFRLVGIAKRFPTWDVRTEEDFRPIFWKNVIERNYDHCFEGGGYEKYVYCDESFSV